MESQEVSAIQLTRTGLRVDSGGVCELRGTPFGRRGRVGLVGNASKDCGCRDVEGGILIVDEAALLLRGAVGG